MTTKPPSKAKLRELEALMSQCHIKEADCIEKFICGSGKGGQKQNKTKNCVYLKHIPSGIEIKCQRSRSKTLNQFYARRQLCEKIAPSLGIVTKEAKSQCKKQKQKKRRQRRNQQHD